VAILPDHRFVLITERYKNENGTTKGWLMDRNRFYSISYLQSDGFEPTDISSLPNGDLLLLERRYNLLRGAMVRVRRLPATDIRPGARLKGEELALLKAPFEVDNFEGLAVHQHPTAGTLLYMISDDNYSFLQRTLLLQFRLIKITP
ncbi:MAG: esterase-like activity of phytase family protein, partial [Candidatus Binatia bacterium]